MKSRDKKSMKEKSESARIIGRMVTPGFINPHSSPPHGIGGPADASTVASQPILPHDAQYPDQAQFEADKRSVYK